MFRLRTASMETLVYDVGPLSSSMFRGNLEDLLSIKYFALIIGETGVVAIIVHTNRFLSCHCTGC